MARFKRLSPSEMDKQRDQAEKALGRLPEDAVRKLADWWGEWYLAAGHRRLGRLLLTRKESSKPEAKLTSTLNRRNLFPGKDDGSNARVIYGGLHYSLAEAHIDSPAFFDVKESAGEVRIILNSAHPAFGLLKATLEQNRNQCFMNSDAAGVDTAVVFTLLKAWADVERQQPAGIRRHNAMMAREDWGRALRDIVHNRKQ